MSNPEDAILAVHAPKLEATETEEEAEVENGDVFVEDTSEYIGNLDIVPVGAVEICVCIDGWNYVYKLDRRYKDE